MANHVLVVSDIPLDGSLDIFIAKYGYTGFYGSILSRQLTPELLLATSGADIFWMLTGDLEGEVSLVEHEDPLLGDRRFFGVIPLPGKSSRKGVVPINRPQLMESLEPYMIDDLSDIILSYMDIGVKFLFQWGGGDEYKELSAIASLRLPDGGSEIFVVDAEEAMIRVYSLRPEGEVKLLRQWGGFKVKNLNYPQGVAILPLPNGKHEIFIVNEGGKIQVFTPEGKLLREWGEEGEEGEEEKDGELYEPMGIALLHRSNGGVEVIIADTGNHQIQMFTPEGKFLRRWGREGDGKGEFRGPTGVASISLPDGRNEIFVTDFTNQRVQVFDSEGKFLRRWGREGEGEGEFYGPSGIVALPGGEVAVADTGNYRIQVFTREGKFLLQWGRGGDGEGEFDSIGGIGLLTLPEGGSAIAVAEMDIDRVQVFGFTLE